MVGKLILLYGGIPPDLCRAGEKIRPAIYLIKV